MGGDSSTLSIAQPAALISCKGRTAAFAKNRKWMPTDPIGLIAAEVLTAFDQTNSMAAAASDLPALAAQEGEPFPRRDLSSPTPACRRRADLVDSGLSNQIRPPIGSDGAAKSQLLHKPPSMLRISCRTRTDQVGQPHELYSKTYTRWSENW
jgi:hypothetical protein